MTSASAEAAMKPTRCMCIRGFDDRVISDAVDADGDALGSVGIPLGCARIHNWTKASWDPQQRSLQPDLRSSPHVFSSRGTSGSM